MSRNEQSPEDMRARFRKIAEEMPCLWEWWGESLRKEKCPCPGCRFRRMVARLGKPDINKQDEVVVFPTIDEIEGAFSGLLAVIERIRKYEKPSDGAVLTLTQEILSSLDELKFHAEHIEDSCQKMMNRNLNGAVRGPVSRPPAPGIPHSAIKVGSMLQIDLIGTVEKLDGESVLVRFDMPGLLS